MEATATGLLLIRYALQLRVVVVVNSYDSKLHSWTVAWSRRLHYHHCPLQEKLGEVEDAKQKAAETAKSLDTVLSRARAIQHRSQLTLHAASTQQAELQERLDKLQLLRSRRDQKVEEEVPHDELESEPGTDEEEQEEEAQEHDETDGVLDLISSDEEEAESPPSEEDEEEEAEVDMVKDIYQYLSDVDTGVAPLVQGFPAVYAYAMHGESDGEVVARHPESQDELTRKDLRRLLPGEWLSDEVRLLRNCFAAL